MTSELDRSLDDVDAALLPDGYHKTTIIEVFVGAWREALDEDGLVGVYLVLLMVLMTVMSVPVLPVFWLLEQLGVSHFD